MAIGRGNIRLSVFAVALLVPLALMGALIVWLRLGRDDVGRDVMNTGNQPNAQGSAAAEGQSAALKPRLVRIGTFDQPLYVTAPPGDRRRVFVVEQPGLVRVV